MTRFLYDGDALIAELDGSNNIIAWYTPGVCMSRYIDGEWKTFYYATDALGTTRQVLDDIQRTTDEYAYNAWGEEFAHLRSATDPEKPENPLRFVGKSGYYTDDSIGLDLLGVRWYDPLIGRFITQDPIRDGLNWYAYAGNNPTSNIDPDGESPLAVAAVGLAAASTALDAYGTYVDVTDFIAHPTILGGGLVVADAYTTINPVLPAPGGIKVGGKIALKYGRKAADALDSASDFVKSTLKDETGAIGKGVHNQKVASAVKKGNKAHKKYSEAMEAHGYVCNKQIPGTKRRPDAYHTGKREVRELKPNNPRAIRRGQKQAGSYAQDLGKAYGGNWKVQIDNY